MAATPPRQRARVRVKGLRINTLLGPDALPPDLVPPEPLPAGNPEIDLELEGSSLVVRAALNGKSVRRALKQVVELGAGGAMLILQGNLKPPSAAGGPFVLDAAGLSVVAKGKPGEPEAPAPPRGA
jgi:hypothetical protein